MLSAEPSGDSASAVVRDTFASFRLAALDLERRAAALLSAVNGGPPPKRDASFLLRQTVALAEETVARARHVEGLNAVLRTSDVLDAAESARGRIQATLEAAESIWSAHGYVSPYAAKALQSPLSRKPPLPHTPTNLFSPAPPKSAHLPDTPSHMGRKSTSTISTMSAPRTPAVLKEKRGWDTDDNWEESPTIDTLAGGLSERGLAILREGMSGTPKPAPPSNPIPGSPPAEPAYHVSPTQQHEDDEYYGGEGYDPETPSSPELERFERDEMEDTFANIALNDRISGGRISMHRGAAAGLEYIDEEDEEEMEEPQEQTRHTFSSRLPGPTTPATLTRTRIPVLTPVAAPPSDSLYPLFAPVSSEEYDGKMDAFGTRATPLDWLNETITAVNEALTDARFDDLDGGAGWRDVTVAELQEMLQLPEGKVLGFIAACLKLGRLVPAPKPKRGQKAYSIVEFAE